MVLIRSRGRELLTLTLGLVQQPWESRGVFAIDSDGNKILAMFTSSWTGFPEPGNHRPLVSPSRNTHIPCVMLKLEAPAREAAWGQR